MLKYRIISFTAFVLLFAAVFYVKAFLPVFEFFADAVIVLGVIALSLAASLEVSALLSRIGFRNSKWVTAVFNLGATAYAFTLTVPAICLSFLPVMILFPALWLFILFRKPRALAEIITAFAAALLVGAPMGLMILINDCVSFAGGRGLLFLICSTKLMDTGGYIFGMLSNKLMKGGNHKIAPSISPKKSWEGFIGGLLLSLASGAVFYFLFSDQTLRWYLIVSGIMGVGSFFGDLTESALKRMAQVKDSGSYIPGMGGALDVVDSFLYNSMLMAAISLFFCGGGMPVYTGIMH